MAVYDRSGGATQRLWPMTRRQLDKVVSYLTALLGSPPIDSIIPAEMVTDAHELARDHELVMVEAPPDPDKIVAEAAMSSGTRSLGGVLTSTGDVQLMILYGTPLATAEHRLTDDDGVPIGLMVPDGYVVIKRDEFAQWLEGMLSWWHQVKEEGP